MLLSQDWLKLKMIRSSIPVLVDSALRDLEPSQLVLFIQSFGIPVDSMTKLLQTLDTAVTADPEAVSLTMVRDYQTQITCCQVSASVLDKAYMGQLVAVQPATRPRATSNPAQRSSAARPSSSAARARLAAGPASFSAASGAGLATASVVGTRFTQATMFMSGRGRGL